MKIAVIIPVWGRHKVLKYCLDSLNDNCINYYSNNNTFKFYFIVSRQDPEFTKINGKIEHFALMNDVTCIIHPNDNLGEKLNVGIKQALKNGFDYMMNFGSDNLIHSNLFDLYEPYLKQNYAVIGINSVTYCDCKIEDGKKTMDSYLNKSDIMVGAGRMIHYTAVKDCFDKFGGLYTNVRQRGLDQDSLNHLTSLGYKPLILDSGDFPYIVDIKTPANINTMETVLNVPNYNIKKIDNQIIESAHGFKGL